MTGALVLWRARAFAPQAIDVNAAFESCAVTAF
jgi:hypothetical protein